VDYLSFGSVLVLVELDDMLEMFPQKVLLTQTMLGVWTPKKLMGYMFIAYGTAVNWKVNL